MASDTGTTEPTKTDQLAVLARKILEAVNNINGGAVSCNSYPEGTEPRRNDQIRRTLVKTLCALNATGGGSFVNVLAYGAEGDGSSNDYAAIQDAISSNPGKIIFFPFGLTFKVNSPLVFENVSVMATGAIINFHATTSGATGHVLRDDVHIEGGTWNTIQDVAAGLSGALHTNFNIGSFSTEVAASGTGYSNVSLKNITISNERDGGNGIFITGDSNNIIIENLTVPASATLSRPIAIHWGGAKTAGTYNVGDTRHPHDITILNVKCGALTKNSFETAPIFVSGAYNITAENIQCEESVVGILLYAGDVGFRWASTVQRALAYTGLNFVNVRVTLCRKYGVLAYGESTDTSNLVWYMPAKFTGCAFNGPADGTLSGSDFAGISPRAVDGLEFYNCTCTGFQYGVYAATHSTRPAHHVSGLRFFGGDYSNNRINGIRPDSSTIAIHDWEISGTTFRLNGWGTSASGAAGIFIGQSESITAQGCFFGDGTSELNQEVGIRVDTTAVASRIVNNHVHSCKTGGLMFAYSLGNAATTGHCAIVSGNTKASGVTTLYSGATLLPIVETPKVTTYGNTSPSINFLPLNETTAVFNVELTANRTIAFTNTAGTGTQGRRLLVVRDASAIGVFTLDVGGLKTLTAAGQWCLVEGTGAALRLVAYGLL